MSALTTAAANAILEHYLNNANVANVGDATGLRGSSTPGSLYISWLTAWPSDAADQSASEATYTGYSRTAVSRSGGAWNVANKKASPAAAIQGGTRTDAGAAQEIVAIGIGAASAGAGTLLMRAHIGGAIKSFTAAAADTITCPGHGFTDDSRVMFFAHEDAALPTGLTEGTRYFVINSTTDTFQVSATQGGAAVDITAAGFGSVAQSQHLSISQGNAPQLSTSTVLQFQ